MQATGNRIGSRGGFPSMRSGILCLDVCDAGQDGDRPRPLGLLPGGRRGPGAAADPRHRRQLRELARGGRASGPPPHRDRPRPARPRRLGGGRRRLLDRRPGRRPARPAAGARPRARHHRRPLARRRRRDAARLPVPGDDRAPGAGLQRRARPRGEPGPARRRPPRRRPLHLPHGRRRPAGRLGARPRPRRGRPAPQRRRRRGRPRLRLARGPRPPRRLPRHAARGGGNRRPAGRTPATASTWPRRCRC